MHRRTAPTAGSVLRTLNIGAWPPVVAVAESTGHAFVLDDGDGAVSMLDTATGRILRTVHAGKLVKAAAIDEQTKRVFLLNAVCPHDPSECLGRSGSVSTLDATTGTLLRTTPVGVYPYLAAVNERANRLFVVNAGAGHTRDYGSVSMLDATTGALLRTVSTVTSPVGLAVDAQTNRVFICNTFSAGTLSVLDATTGVLLRTVPAEAAPGTLVVDQPTRRVFLAAMKSDGSRDLLLDVFDAATGALLRTVPYGGVVGGSVAMAVDERTGHVFAVNARERRVSMIDGRTGTVLRTVMLSRPPWVITIDPQTTHAFVLTRGKDSDLNPPGASVAVLDMHSGRLLRTVDLGNYYSGALAVDRRRGHVFVATAGVATDPNSTPPGRVTMLAAGP